MDLFGRCRWCGFSTNTGGCSNPQCPGERHTLPPSATEEFPQPMSSVDRIRELEEALRTYGRHARDCNTEQTVTFAPGRVVLRMCTCGLAQVLEPRAVF